MGLERGYQVKIPSNQVHYYSTSKNQVRTKLNPWFITGFSDAEASFIILIQPRTDTKLK
jgi:hypothetical protein